MMNTSKPPRLPPKPHAVQSLIPPEVPPRCQPSQLVVQKSSLICGNVKPSSEYDYMSMKHAYINAPIVKQSLLEPPHLSSPAQPDTSSSTHNVAQPTYSTVTSSQHTPLQIQDTVYNPSYGALSTEIMQPECMYDCLDYPLPFNKLVEENAVDLPLQVDICESIYGMVGGDSLFQNEKLDVYFMKHTEVVKISKSGVNCSNWLPLSSAYQCNVFTCENGWQYAAKKKFSNMESLLKASTLPLVVYVTSDKKSLSIQAGELLIIKSVELSKKNKVKSMNCWSISTHKKKHLDGSCVKYFSINPEQTKVYIHDVIEHYKLPMYAIFYFSPSSAERVTIEEKLVMKSAIARKVAASESSDEILEIMLMAELMMRKREVANKYHAELVMQSCSLYEKFNPALVNKVIPSICGFDSFQTQLFRHVLANWSNSTELYYPKHAPPINSPAAAQDLIIPSPPPLPPSSRPTTLTAATDTCNNESVDYEGVYYAYDDTVNDPISIKETRCTEPLPSWRESSQRYQYFHENHKILITYTTKQVLELLDALHLSKYKNEFENEAIDGLLFIDLNKKMLEELTVTSALHQRKIMQLIEGVKSITELISEYKNCYE